MHLEVVTERAAHRCCRTTAEGLPQSCVMKVSPLPEGHEELFMCDWRRHMGPLMGSPTMPAPATSLLVPAPAGS